MKNCLVLGVYLVMFVYGVCVFSISLSIVQAVPELKFPLLGIFLFNWTMAITGVTGLCTFYSSACRDKHRLVWIWGFLLVDTKLMFDAWMIWHCMGLASGTTSSRGHKTVQNVTIANVITSVFLAGCMEYMYKYHGHFLALVWKRCTQHITLIKLIRNVHTVDDNPLVENNSIDA
jgi:hypothetical protein